MSVITRFAPSPTGKIHVGNLRPAILSYMFAKNKDGKFMLRIDDTDLARSTKENEQAIKDDLKWLGLSWDIEDSQSKRFARYDEIAEMLKEKGLLYPCYETSDELERRRKRQLARGKPPVYDRAALKLTLEERKKLEDEGRKPHWRFKLEEKQVIFHDLIRGEQKIDAASLSDPVLIREDGTYLYTLPSVIDDIDFKITHIIRGEDHVANTGVQVQIFEALEAKVPAFAHHNLLVSHDGSPLSKRLGSLTIESFREKGLEPLAVLSHAVTLGTSDPVEPYPSIKALADNFAFEKLSRAPARFDEEELKGVNAKLLHTMEFESAKDKLEALGITGGEDFWQAVRPNLSFMKEAGEWWQLCAGEIAPVIEDENFIKQAADLLPSGDLDKGSWGAWTKAISNETGAKGKQLFMPLRLALTGQTHGPSLKDLLPLIGRDKILARLSGKTA